MAFVLVASCFAIGQTNDSGENPQVGAQSDEKPFQTGAPTAGIPTFRAEARQLLVTAVVWDSLGKNNPNDESLFPKRTLKRLPNALKDIPEHLPVPARGLAAKDFKLLDNGAEQRINYLKESDSALDYDSPQWSFSNTKRGTWGFPPEVVHNPSNKIIEMPAATYLIGYVPPALASGECHAIRLVAEGRELELDRNEYCAPTTSDKLDPATLEGTTIGTQMRAFADSAAHGTIKVVMQASALWSSGVLSMTNESSPTGNVSASRSGDLTYVVEVHDSKAPATLHIATGFDPPQMSWNDAYCSRSHPALHVLGIAYKVNGEVAGQFGNTYACTDDWISARAKFAHLMSARQPSGGLTPIPVPTRFDTQIDLEPGDYELRVVVSDGQGNFGRAQIPLHVEPYDGQQLAISDLAFSSIQRDASWAVREAAHLSPATIVPTPLVSGTVQFIPETDTRHRKHSPVALYCEIYEPLLTKQKVAVYLRSRVIDLKNGSVVVNTLPMSAADYILPGNMVIPIGLKLGTNKLKKGHYRLEMQASDSAGQETEWRHIEFTIE